MRVRSAQVSFGQPSNVLLHLHEEDGKGEYARADVDIIVVDSCAVEAERKMLQTLQLVRCAVGPHIVIRTPNGLTVVPQFPQKHIQIITLYNHSLSEYLNFVDLDCTSMAYDGDRVFGSRRAVLAFAGRSNLVTEQMLNIRRDTPRRIAKYARRGFGLNLFCGQDAWEFDTTAAKLQDVRRLFEKAPRWTIGIRFGDLLEGEWETEEYARCLVEHSPSYSETNLPRGHGITPEIVVQFLWQYQAKYAERNQRLIASIFDGFLTTVAPKVVVKDERWWQFGVVM